MAATSASSLPGTCLEPRLIACHECDLLHRVAPQAEPERGTCSRCGGTLYPGLPQCLDRAAALNLTGLLLFFLANAFPFLTLKLSGREVECLLLSCPLSFWREGMPELGVLVLLTAIAFPCLSLGANAYLLLARKLDLEAPASAWVYRITRWVTPWSMTAVFLLGVIISLVKLQDLASVIPGISFFAFVGLFLILAIQGALLDPALLWPRGGPAGSTGSAGATAAARGLVACHTCTFLLEEGQHDCPRCGTGLHKRKPQSLERTAALSLSATFLLIPANLYPVMAVTQLGQGEPSTILGGVVHLVQEEMWPLALLVFFASFVIPILKLGILAFLIVSVKKRSSWRPRDRTFLFRVTELIGAWSMVDVYLVAVMIALVNLGALAQIIPGPGVTFFACAVTLTILAAHTFDPRLIWDRCGDAS